jgi:type II secretory pathway component PulL
MRYVLLIAAVLLSACSPSNNLFLGRVQAQVGSHTVVVTDCYRASVPPQQRLGDAVYRFTPCRDADVLIRGDELLVNGQSYGRLNPPDAVLVDHGVVSIERR